MGGRRLIPIAVTAVMALARPVFADDMNATLLRLEDRWAEIRYEMKDNGEKLAAGKVLAADAAAAVAAYPGRAEPLIWQGLALLVEAEVRQNLSALGLVKDARRALENAEAADPLALDGLIQTTLGMMYYEVPGWPLAFGDKQKAQDYLARALEINPTGKDTNYFFGDYLVMTGRGREAVAFLEQALAAPVRPGHERADKGRRADIQESLDKARKSR